MSDNVSLICAVPEPSALYVRVNHTFLCVLLASFRTGRNAKIIMFNFSNESMYKKRKRVKVLMGDGNEIKH